MKQQFVYLIHFKENVDLLWVKSVFLNRQGLETILLRLWGFKN